ncbi:PREDICTED: uncharacterized protein LOC104752871 [Camelina sativa]|uniref:Uncharacterized protein LOC104752871 n=1 Tax=Camelina sativa TaxID=90675 RepID=A0ABM0WMX9_CAMSA|nr:PREDICTED: uncharacterized protein LOC104752871 [Camelina sativa]
MNLVTKLLVMVLLFEVVCANVGARPLEEVSKVVTDKVTFPPLPPLPIPPPIPGLPIPAMKSRDSSRVLPKMSNGDTGRVENEEVGVSKDATAVPDGPTARGYGSGSSSSDASGRTHP